MRETSGDRRSRFAHRLCLVALALAGGACSGGAPERRPNVLLIVTDDQGYGDASCYGDTDLATPTMDAVAASGARLTRFRVNPTCAPTRASLMTGLYPAAAGMWRGPDLVEDGSEPEGGWPESARRIRDDVLLLPELLKTAGYATGIFGKWHLGSDERNVPGARGFDEFVGFLGALHPYWTRGSRRILRGGEVLQARGHTTDLFANEAIRFVREHRDVPFFCYLAFNAVHDPLRTAEHPFDSGRPEWLARYEEAGVAQPRRDYCAVMSHADARAGHVLDALRELGLEEHTLVLYLSDNGARLDPYPGDNGPWRGGKGEVLEGGIRVPAVVRWPGRIPAGTVSDADAAHFDVFATILDAAGLPLPAENGGRPVEGRSLLPHLRSGAREGLPARYLFWDFAGEQAALRGSWKLVGSMPNHQGDFRRAAADAEAGEFALYDLESDPRETRDVAAEHPEVHADLKRRHVEWLGSL